MLVNMLFLGLASSKQEHPCAYAYLVFRSVGQ